MRSRRFGMLAGPAIALSVITLSAIALSACGDSGTPSPAASSAAQASPPAASHTEASSPTPTDYESLLFAYDYQPAAGRTGGKVVISDYAAPSQLNPAYLSSGAEAYVYAATMRTLFTVTSDGHWKADLAARMPTFGDGTIRPDTSGTGFSVDVELRPNLKWSDGTPATLHDLAFTWRFVMDPQNTAISTAGWEEIDRIDVTDDTSATVHFKKAFAGFYGVIGGLFLPEHYVTTVPVADASTKLYPLSSDITDAVTIGPFRYSTASADTIELVRDDEWAGPAEACGGRACLDAVTFEFFPDNKDGMIAAFLGGDVDVIEHLVQSDYDVIKGVDPSIGRAILAQDWAYEHLDMNEAGLGQGEGHPALKDVTVRRAIEQAIDKEALYRTVFPGAPLPDEPACVNAAPTSYWQLSDATCPPFDVVAANAALDAAGYTRGADGIRTMPNDPGTKLEMEFCTSTEAFRQTGAQFIARALEGIGIKVDLDFVDAWTVLFAQWSDVAADTTCNLAHGNYDLSQYAYVLTFDLWTDYYYAYHSEQIPTVAKNVDGYDYLRFSDPDMDSALDALKSAIKPNEQLQAAYTIQRIYIDQVPEIALYYRDQARGISARLQGFYPNPALPPSDLWNIEDWWVAR